MYKSVHTTHYNPVPSESEYKANLRLSGAETDIRALDRRISELEKIEHNRKEDKVFIFAIIKALSLMILSLLAFAQIVDIISGV